MKGAHALVGEGVVGLDDDVLALEPTACRLRIAVKTLVPGISSSSSRE